MIKWAKDGRWSLGIPQGARVMRIEGTAPHLGMLPVTFHDLTSEEVTLWRKAHYGRSYATRAEAYRAALYIGYTHEETRRGVYRVIRKLYRDQMEG